MADFLRKNRMLERLRLLERISTILGKYVSILYIIDRKVFLNEYL